MITFISARHLFAKLSRASKNVPGKEQYVRHFRYHLFLVHALAFCVLQTS